MQTLQRARWWCVPLIAAALPAAIPAPTNGETIVLVPVPGTSDPWLAGMPDGSTASCWEPEGCDVAPAQSPQLVVGLCLIAGESLTFQATGGVAHAPGFPLQPPDGSNEVTNHNWDDDYAENGISDIIAPYDCLLGVFLDDVQPDQTPAPENLDFSLPASRNYHSIAPDLKQVFFIGDGLTSAGEVQQIVIPDGATRFYLGTMDSSTWLNNIGQFEVVVSEPCAPTASTNTSWGMLKARYR